MRTRVITAATRLLGLLRPSPPPLPRAPSRVLILKPCCLGDVLLTTPLVAMLRQHYPAATLEYAVGPWARPMVLSNHHLDRVWQLPERWTLASWLATLHTLRMASYDLAFVPDRSPILSALVALAGVPARVGLNSLGRGFGYTHPVTVPSTVLHEADLYQMLGTTVGASLPERRLWFWPTSDAEAEADALLASLQIAEKPLVVLHGGGGANPGMTLHRKRWLPERWAAVADQLVADYEASVILIGGPGDEEAVAAIKGAMHCAAIEAVRRWDWSVLGALLQRARLFLGHDTGMMHLASAVCTPTIVVFGPSDPQMYGPYGLNGRVIWRPTASSPCFQLGSAPAGCPCAYQCMRNVEVDDVLAVAHKVLASPSCGAQSEAQ